MKFALLILLFLPTGIALGQPFDLGFEDSLISNSPGPGHWQSHDDSYLHYTAEIVPNPGFQGKRALLITAKGSSLSDDIRDPSTAVISQTFDAGPYTGKRIRYSLFAKRISGDGDGELLMIVHRGNAGAYNVNEEFDPSSAKWKQYEIIADIRPSATEIVIRIQTKGECSILFDSVAFEIVDKTVMTEREKRAYYRVVEFYEGFTKQWVYEGEIRYINGSSLGGTIVMTNGRQYRFNRLAQGLIDRINKKYEDGKK